MRFERPVKNGEKSVPCLPVWIINIQPTIRDAATQRPQHDIAALLKDVAGRQGQHRKSGFWRGGTKGGGFIAKQNFAQFNLNPG